MADINALVDQLSALTVLEAAELSKALEEKWGVSAAAAVAVAGPAAAADDRDLHVPFSMGSYQWKPDSDSDIMVARRHFAITWLRRGNRLP